MSLLSLLLRLASRKDYLRSFVSGSIQSYRFLFGKGLRPKSPLDLLRKEVGSSAPPDATIRLPAVLGGGGGTRPDEMAYLAATTKLLAPRTIFEIGTFTGLTTEKMAAMLGDRSLVFWHDYGGVGEFRPLTSYLERLSRHAPLYQVPFMTLAWTTGPDLKAALVAARSDRA